MAYKLEWRGGRIILVNPAYTSRTCRVCGFESKDARKSQAIFACTECGHTENADIHAAKNILAAGHAVWVLSKSQGPIACGGDIRRESRKADRAALSKQEPTKATQGVFP